MRRSLERDIAAYEAMIEALPSYAESEEVSALLVWREVLQDRIDTGERLAAPLATLLEAADQSLRDLLPDVANRFPDVFALEPVPPDRLWWWHPERLATSAA